MKLSTDIVKKLLEAISATKDKEMSCSECYKEVEKFGEIELAGKSPAEAMPLVEEHMQKCPDCKEEYEVLLTALKELND